MVEHDVIAVKHGEDGSIVEYQLASGEVISHEECVNRINSGELSELMTFETRDGGVGIHSKRGIDNYKLEDSPEIK